MNGNKKLLFICTGNACRSPIAEGILKHLASEDFDVFSAGTHPTQVHSLAIKVMQEWDIDISNQTSDHIDKYLDMGINIVITLCESAEAICPTFAGNVKRDYWNIPDPFPGWVSDPQYLVKFREVRNLIRSQIEAFLEDHRSK